MAAAAWLAIPAAAQAAGNDLGVTQTISATKAKPGGTIDVTSTVTNLGTQTESEATVELAALKGKILVIAANDPYTSFSSSQGSCSKNAEQGITTQALVCSLGALAPGQSAQIHATIRVQESAIQQTNLLPPRGERIQRRRQVKRRSHLADLPRRAGQGERLQAAEADRGAEELRDRRLHPDRGLEGGGRRRR